MSRTLPALLGPAGRQWDLALALIESRVVRPGRKLSTLSWWSDITLGVDLGVAYASTAKGHAAMDWMLSRQDSIALRSRSVDQPADSQPDPGESASIVATGVLIEQLRHRLQPNPIARWLPWRDIQSSWGENGPSQSRREKAARAPYRWLGCAVELADSRSATSRKRCRSTSIRVRRGWADLRRPSERPLYPAARILRDEVGDCCRLPGSPFDYSWRPPPAAHMNGGGCRCTRC